MKLVSLVGRRFERWEVLAPAERSNRGASKWMCQCDCGTRRVVFAFSLLSGRSKCCGCDRKNEHRRRLSKHGETTHYTKSREYSAWISMKARCYNPRGIAYHRYGGRGIYVSDEWRFCFETFLRDMGRCPPGLTLDRINNDGPYAAGNCRWATMREQGNNRSTDKDIQHATSH